MNDDVFVCFPFAWVVWCNGADREQNDSVIFEPSRGIIRVGDRTEFKCIRPTDEDSNIIGKDWTDARAYFRLTDLTNRTDLLSTRDGEWFGSVLPPKWLTEYVTVGSTIVRCEYIREGETKATTELHVHILREFNRPNVSLIEFSRESFRLCFREYEFDWWDRWSSWGLVYLICIILVFK